MVTLMIRHTIADYATFRPAFDAHEAFRRANGATGVGQLYRDEGNPNQITAVVEWDNAENGRRFASSASLKEAMQAAGVTSTPEVHFLNRT